MSEAGSLKLLRVDYVYLFPAPPTEITLVAWN